MKSRLLYWVIPLAWSVFPASASPDDSAKSPDRGAATIIRIGDVSYTLPFTLPSSEEIVRALPDAKAPPRGLAFVAEHDRKITRIQCRLLNYRLEKPRVFPLVGPARLSRATFKCTVDYETIIRSDWPVPFTHSDQTSVVVYIDREQLIPAK